MRGKAGGKRGLEKEEREIQRHRVFGKRGHAKCAVHKICHSNF
jgi:hypothetical protein